MPRKQNKNLKPVQSENEAREKGKKGGIKSGEVRREKKTTQDLAKIILSGKIPGESAQELVEQIGVPTANRNVKTAILAGQALEAIKGNTRAAEYLIGLSGEQTATESKQEEKEYELPARVFGSEWVNVNRSIDRREYFQYDFKGGRGSLKSSFCGLKIVELIKRNPTCCALAIRQLKDDIGKSIFAQIKWAIDELGLTEEFHFTKSPYMIKKINTGQIIYFEGANDPSKIKSIRPPKDMHIGVVWVEEADQLFGAEALRNIKQSAFRGGDDGILFRTFNTPISQRHYINEELRKNDTRRFVHHSYYYNAPVEWIGKPFIEEANALKESNERAYRHEYLGEPVGTGGSVFENAVVRDITDDELKSFEHFYYGVDWGFYPDPWAFVKCAYSANKRSLYILDERIEYKKNNRQTADILINEKHITRDDMIICDSSEPKSIADYASYGLYARGAEKSAGSLNYSMKWLQGLTKIIIDKNKCPHTAREFLEYEYEKTRDGEIISGYPDKNNHFIDSVRYSTNLLWREGVK